MSSSQSKEVIPFPEFPHFSIPRDELVALGSKEIASTIPQGVTMGNSAWKMWEELTQTRAELGRLEVVWLKTKSFSNEIRKLLDKRNARLVLIRQPIVVFGPPGRIFDDIYCTIDFSAVDSKSHNRLRNRPVIHEMFPASHWNTVLKWGGGLSLGINSSGEFALNLNAQVLNTLTDTEVELVDELLRPTLGAKIQGGIDISGESETSFIIEPFEYIVRRPLIRSEGDGCPVARWYFGRGPATEEKIGLIEETNLLVGALLLVPEDACLEIRSRLAARHHINLSVPSFASLLDTIQLVSTAVREFVVGGMPLVDESLNGEDPSLSASPICVA